MRSTRSSAALFAWALLNFGNIYYAIALRARDLAVASARKKTSLAVSRLDGVPPRDPAHGGGDDAGDRRRRAAPRPRSRRTGPTGVDHGAWWPAKIVAAKYHAVESAKRVVDLAMDMSGGAGMFKSNELERLYRDVRCGGFHPANSALVHEIVGKTTLGIDLGEQPRWG